MKKRVGIIGCGHILVRHVEAINQNPEDFELVALCDTDKEVLKKAVEENGNVEGFEDYKKMLKDMKGKMDMVVIATLIIYIIQWLSMLLMLDMIFS